MSYQKQFQGDTKKLGRVAVLYGGFSAEREISLLSGETVLCGLLDAGVDAIGVDVSKNMVSELIAIKCDRVFIALHGIGGEDGKAQALLELLDIPYTGSGVAASAVALDKLKTKHIWQGVGLPTPKYAVLSESSDWSSVLDNLGGEVFVKPANEGSSLGICCACTADELKEAYLNALPFDKNVIAETKITGREFSVSILNGVALPAIELKTNNVFYDYDAKYFSDETQYIFPEDLTRREQEDLSALAIQAFCALDCQAWGRVDFMQDQEGKFYLLEVNTIPGMTSHSIYPMSAKKIGLELGELLLEILATTTDASA
ncbi:D-alanine--D-alanine ligase [Agarilytica rhodophyticola]|uniref:D-alanine--D-alanine ligase n=1 Tax=Agarilytica rhodophyticola TaxID=1737490 RepID=UPI000B348B0F|nr:D-alanine--D-alanine ligase [Agarilytica rhodophyticola]